MLNLSSVTQDTWENISEIGFVVVIGGVVLEAVDLIHKWRKRGKVGSEPVKEHDGFLIVESISLILVVVGLAVELFASHRASLLAHEKTNELQQQTKDAVTKAGKADKEAADANERASANERQVAALNQSTLKLVAQYDLSTNALEEANNRLIGASNALAEANSRLASIRPLKQRLTEWLNMIDASVIPALKNGRTNFSLPIPLSEIGTLSSFAREPGSGAYISSINVGYSVDIGGPHSMSRTVDLGLKPELAQ